MVHYTCTLYKECTGKQRCPHRVVLIDYSAHISSLYTNLISSRPVTGRVFPAVVHEVHESRECWLSITLVNQRPLSLDDSLVQLLRGRQALKWTLTSEKLKDEHGIGEDVDLH